MPRKTDHAITATLAKNFRKFRVEMGLSQSAAAERIKITVSALSKIEQGVNTPGNPTISAAGGVYGHDPADFFMDEPPPAKPRPAERQIWFAKVAPGVEPDADLQADVDRFLANVNRRQNERLRERKKKGQ